MVFKNESEAVARIDSVHHLFWEKQKNIIMPRKYSCMSLRVEGNSVIRYKGKEIKLNKGDISLFKPGVQYEIDAGKEELYVVHFELLSGDISDDIVVIHPDNFILMKTLFSELCEIRMSPEAGYHFSMQSILYRIFNEISEFSALCDKRETNIKIRTAVQYLSSHFTDPGLSIETVAKEVGISNSYLRRLFSEIMEKRPLEYLNRLRIDYAKELLKSGYYSVEQAALLSGFEDTKYFSTVFKKYRGISPSEYKKIKQ